jgi:hypothetical protein
LSQLFFCDGFSWHGVLQTICLGLALNQDPLISASWVARITGVSHQCLPEFHYLSRVLEWFRIFLSPRKLKPGSQIIGYPTFACEEMSLKHRTKDSGVSVLQYFTTRYTWPWNTCHFSHWSHCCDNGICDDKPSTCHTMLISHLSTEEPTEATRRIFCQLCNAE